MFDLRRYALVALTALTAAGALFVSTARAGTAAAERSVVVATGLERSLPGLVNSLRKSHGLRPLAVSARLSRAARSHAVDMGKHGFFDHGSADGTSPADRIGRFYPAGSGTWGVGETLAWAAPDLSPVEALRIWLNSAPHRQILLTAQWREVGIGAARVADAGGVFGGGPVTIVVADFGVRSI